MKNTEYFVMMNRNKSYRITSFFYFSQIENSFNSYNITEIDFNENNNSNNNNNKCILAIRYTYIYR